MKTLLLFRRDLRIEDHAALHWACEQNVPIVPFFVYDPNASTSWPLGAASRWWLQQSLERLSTALAAKGLHLHCFCGETISVLRQILADSQASNFVWHVGYEPSERRLDQKISEEFSQKIRLVPLHGGSFFIPGSLLNQQEKPYQVFTPFWRKAQSILATQLPPGCSTQIEKRHIDAQSHYPYSLQPADLPLLAGYPWHQKLHQYWTCGEQAAWERLNNFMADGIDAYDHQRDFPAIPGTSGLSPHLHFGEITPQQIYRTLVPMLDRPNNAQQASSLQRFFAELGWREFAIHVLWHFPTSDKQSIHPQFELLWPKKPDPYLLKKWQQGNTGIPLVDAGMRQLWETGWMHNRVRMIVASFLTKNLGIHWIEGAKWFWDTLVDADLASNSLGWQWSAGCGLDAAPYYRIFNPNTQAERFDADGKYQEKWIAERGSAAYPNAVVDLTTSRKDALLRLEKIKERK